MPGNGVRPSPRALIFNAVPGALIVGIIFTVAVLGKIGPMTPSTAVPPTINGPLIVASPGRFNAEAPGTKVGSANPTCKLFVAPNVGKYISE